MMLAIFLKEANEIQVKIIGVDRKKRVISVSVKALVSEEEAAAVQDYSNSQPNVNTTFGDLFKEQMENQE